MRKARIYNYQLDYHKINYGKGPCQNLGSKTKTRNGRHRLPWAKSEIDFIRDNYLTLSDDQLSEELKRTPYAIQQRRYKLRLRREKQRIAKVKIISGGYFERNQIILIHKKVTRMKELINLCEEEENNYKKDQYKKELKKLSGL